VREEKCLGVGGVGALLSNPLLPVSVDFVIGLLNFPAGLSLL
jgi:hypothetical protein